MPQEFRKNGVIIITLSNDTVNLQNAFFYGIVYLYIISLIYVKLLK